MDSQIALTREQSRRIDQIAIEHYGIPGVVLMENAGRGATDVLLQLDPSLVLGAKGDAPSVAILCGKGNNAGDGFVIARHLAIRGVPTIALLLCPPDELHGDALTNYRILTHSSTPLVDLSKELADVEAPRDAAPLFDLYAAEALWLIDAMLGTGAVGEPRHPFSLAIEWMNSRAGRRLAVDVPSGLDCDTGEPASRTLRADVTCTFVAKKVGFLQPAAQPLLGEVHVVSIGTPTQLLHEVAGDLDT